ncbi:uncharacterized protein LOC143566361 [Bidens hawaiensis]|uniref:uncharacterized protein LOC143566361 n=1 Tax=Bidens hawaiensis TaxID=980011 RepID=UPI00404AD448
MPWEELKEAMTKEFCPEHELERLEAKFWELKQDSGDNSTYSNRFRELSRIVPHLVTPEHRDIQKYIRGLPNIFRDAVVSRDPLTISEAMDLAASLTDSHVRDGTLSRKDSKPNPNKTETNSSTDAKAEPKPASNNNNHRNNHNNSNKHKAYAVNQPNNQPPPNQNQNAPNKKAYAGPYPLCVKCNHHHSAQSSCRLCTKCNHFGHLANTCRVPPNAQAAPHAQPIVPYTRACYKCGDPNHLRNTCHKLIHAHQAQTMTAPNYFTHAHQVQTHPSNVLQAPPINKGQPYLTQQYQAPHPQAQVYQAYSTQAPAMQVQPIQAIPSQSTLTAPIPMNATPHGAPSHIS